MPRTSTAARLATVKRDKYGRPLSVARSSGTPYSGDANAGNIGVGAEVYMGGQGWVDISPYIYYRDGSTKVAISRGRLDEVSTVQPQTCSFQLNNRDSRFSPRNPVGPYYQLIGRNTPIRFFRYSNGIKRYRFAGEMPEWPTAADITGRDVYCQATAYGMLRRLRQGTQPPQSALYRAYTKGFFSLITGSTGGTFDAGENVPNVVAYWPCEDQSSSSAPASALSGGPAMTVTGSPTFAADSSFVASQPIPVVNSSTWTGAAPTGITWTDNVLRFLMHIPSGGDTNGAVVMRMYTSGSIARVDLTYSTTSGGELTFAGFNAAGSTVFTVGPFLEPSGAGFNGVLQRCSMALRTSGSSVEWEFQATQVGSGSVSTTNGTVASSSVGAVSSVVVDPNSNLVGTSIGHISIQNVWDDLGNLIDTLSGWIGEETDRLVRLCQEEGVNQYTVYGVFNVNGNGDGRGFDYPSGMGNQLPGAFPDLVQQCIDVDAGMLFEARDQVALLWRTRTSLYNQGTVYGLSPFQLTLDYAQNQLSTQPVPRDDDYYTKNDVTVQQTNGTSARKYLNDGSAMSISPPPVGVGEGYAVTYPLNICNDFTFGGQMTIADHASWRLHLGTVNEPRYPTISVNLRHPQFTGNQNLTNAALSVDIGDVIQINNPPPWLPPDNPRLIIQGIQETMGAFEHDIVFTCSPESPYRVGVFDDPVLGRYDTDGSTLAAPLGNILNPNGFFAGGSSAGWGTFGCTLAVVGTSGSASPLPSGGPTGYGAKVTVDGTSGPGIFGSSAPNAFPIVPGAVYYVSALANYPAALQQMFIGIQWYDANFNFVSNGTTAVTVTANTWTALSSSFTAPASGAVWGAPVVGLSGASTPGDVYYTTNAVCWQGAMSAASTNTLLPAWTTSAAAFPFDIVCGGERMTVTTITGASSPQTFTVARAVNSVAKAQTTGTDVRLWQPSIVSL